MYTLNGEIAINPKHNIDKCRYGHLFINTTEILNKMDKKFPTKCTYQSWKKIIRNRIV